MSVNKQRVTAFWSRFRQRFSTLNWVTALWSVALFFLFPVVAVFKFTDIPLYDAEYFILNAMEGQLYFVSALSIFIAPITTNAFNYLNSRTQLDFYHSQPVTRKELFFTNYFAGWLSFAAPLTTAFLLEAIIIFAFNGVLSPLAELGRGYVSCMLVYFAINAIFTLSVMLCGKRFTSLITGTFLCILPYAVVYMISEYFFMMSKTFTSLHAELSKLIMSCVHPLVSVFRFTYNSDGLADALLPSDLRDDLWIQGIWVVVSAIAVLTALWLYTRRKSEDAEKAFVFPRIIPFLRYPAIIFIAWLGGFLFEEYADGYFWKLFGICISGVIAFFSFSFIEKRGFRNAFRAWRKLLLSAGAYFACVMLIYACAVVFDSRTAKDEDVVAIDVTYISYKEYYYLGTEYFLSCENDPIRITAPENIKNINSLLRDCVEEKTATGVYVDNKLSDDEIPAGASLGISAKVYTKNGEFERSYRLFCNADGTVKDRIYKFAYCTEAVLAQRRHDLFALDTSREGFVFQNCEYFSSSDETLALYNAIKKDIECAVPSDYEERPIDSIDFYFTFYENVEEQTYHDTFYDTIPVVPSYKNTLALVGEKIKTDNTLFVTSPAGEYDSNAYNGKAELATEQNAYDIGRAIGKYYGQRDSQSTSAYTEIESFKAGYNSYTDAFNEGLKKGYDEGFDKDVAFAAGYEKGYKRGTEIGENAVKYGGDGVPPKQKEADTNFRKGYNEGFVDGFNDVYYSND